MENSSDLSKGLLRLKSEIVHMQRDITHGPKKPHKLVMLLAVINLYEKSIIETNIIPFDSHLTSSFSNVFNLIRIKGEWNQPAIPYFHLRTSSFWHHKVKPGRETAYLNLSTSGGGSKRILDNIEHVYLSDYCFQVLSDPSSRQEIKEFIIEALNPYANFEQPSPIKPFRTKRG